MGKLYNPSVFVHSHRSRDDERLSKPASTPAKLVEEVPLPKPKEPVIGRDEKQLPPLPGQRSTVTTTSH